MKKYLVICASMALLASLSSCKGNETETEEVGYMLPATRSVELTNEQKELVTNNNGFAFNLVRKINEERKADGVREKNLFVSPLSATCILGMLNSGANDECQRKISEVLDMSGATAQGINEFCYSLMTQATNVDNQVSLETANALFTNKDIHVNSQYATTVSKYYDTKVQSLDFSVNNAAEEINNWAKEKSHGMITKLFDRLNADEDFYLLNTVCFEAMWKMPFDKSKTTSEPFVSQDGSQHDVEMMHLDKALVLTEANDCFTSVCLPYGSGNNWNMYVLLPNKGKTVDDVINCLNADKWSMQVKNYKNNILNLSIPKFNVVDDIELDKALEKMGLDCLFKSGSLSRMIDNKDRISACSINQKNSIDVNEEGAKMVAVTIAHGDLIDYFHVDEPQIEDGNFSANRPFVFVVAESSSNAVFFVGTYTGK